MLKKCFSQLFLSGVLVLFLLLFFGLAPMAMASPGYAPAGTVISNRAYADYQDANGNPLTRIYSNTVTTTVTQIAGVDVTPATSRKAAAKNTYTVFGASVKNTGNGTDNFDLTATNPDSWPVKIYWDENNDDHWDPNTETIEVHMTGNLAQDETFEVVVVVWLTKAGIVLGDETDTTFTATSRFDPTDPLGTDYGTYTSVVQDALLNVTKAVDTSAGKKPGDIVIFSITGYNNGTATAQDVVITDLIPAYTTYVPESGRIGDVGGTYDTATPQTDANTGIYNYNITTPDAITVKWGDANSGDSGVIYFKTQVNSNVPYNTRIENGAQIKYRIGGVLQPTYESGRAWFYVDTMGGVTLTPASSNKTGNPSDQMIYPLTICNTGNRTDIFKIEYSSSLAWTWVFWMDVDGNGIPGTNGDYILTDTNGDGKIDTGQIPQSGCRNILAVATVPAGLSDGTVDLTTVTATSTNDPTVSATSTLTTTVTAPALTMVKEVDPIGNQPPTTELTYTITVTNAGSGSATHVTIYDVIPTYTTYKASSIYTGSNVSSLVHRTDASCGDGACYDENTNEILVGTATNISLGQNGTWVARFTAIID